MFFFVLRLDGSEFTEENASTTEADDNKVSEEIEDMEEEENTDGVSGTSGAGESGTEAIEVNNAHFFLDLSISIEC